MGIDWKLALESLAGQYKPIIVNKKKGERVV